MSKVNQGAVIVAPGAAGALTVWRAPSAVSAALQLVAVGSSQPIPTSNGVCAGDISVFTSGAPTAVSAVIEGSNDLNNWTQLPLPSTSLTGQTYTYIRLRLVTLTGGTSPTVTLVGFATE